VVIHTRRTSPSHELGRRKAPLVDFFGQLPAATLNLLEAGAGNTARTRASYLPATKQGLWPTRPKPLAATSSSPPAGSCRKDHPYGRYGIDETMSIDQTMHRPCFGGLQGCR